MSPVGARSRSAGKMTQTTAISVFSSHSARGLVGLLGVILIFLFMEPGRAQDTNSTISPTGTSSAQPEVTKVVQIFFIDEPGYEGLAYTLFHRDSGSVLGIEEDRTTYVITTTRTDLRPKPTGNTTASATTLPSTTRRFGPPGGWRNGTGQPSTITQGPATFLYTGTRFGPGRTVYGYLNPTFTLSLPFPPS